MQIIFVHGKFVASNFNEIQIYKILFLGYILKPI